MTARCNLVARTASDLIAAIPYLLGYHPADCVVVVGMAGRTIAFAACSELPPPDCDDGENQDDAVSLAQLVARQEQVGSAMVVGYGPAARVTPVVLRTGAALQMLGIRVHDALRVTDGRWWSYVCEDPRCCPPDGTPCLPGDSVIAAEAAFGGIVALPDREAMVAQVAPVDGPARAAMVTATARARKRFGDLVDEGADGKKYGRLIRRAGRTAVRDAERRCRAGRTLTDDEVAWLGLLLVDQDVLDYAMNRTDADDWRVRLWTDVVRRVEPSGAAGPACVLGFAAWRNGQGSLARVAVDRALHEEPDHEVAGMLHEMLGFGIGPRMLARTGRQAR